MQACIVPVFALFEVLYLASLLADSYYYSFVIMHLAIQHVTECQLKHFDDAVSLLCQYFFDSEFNNELLY